MIKHLFMQKRGNEATLFIIGKRACDNCQTLLQDIAMHLYSVSAGEAILCGTCYKKVTPLTKRYTQAESRIGIVTDEIPRGAFPIVSPASFTYGTPEDVPTTGIKIIDRTKYAGRPEYTLDPSVQIGSSVPDDERLSFSEAEALLEDLRNSTPVTNQRLIE